jgi:hypothetical protein
MCQNAIPRMMSAILEMETETVMAMATTMEVTTNPSD